MVQNIEILLAEDDKNLGTILKAYLEAKGCKTTLCVNGREALETFRQGKFNLCILDVMMPQLDGFTVAYEIRKDDKRVPIIFLTAKTLQEDILKGFEVGGDDYITKPFSMDELMARINAVCKRYTYDMQKQTEFVVGSFIFDSSRHILMHNGDARKLTSKEADLLLLLCENMNNTLERKTALNKVWFEDTYANARSMDVYITKLRKIFKEDPNVQLQNIHGVGFKLSVNND